MGMPKQVKKAEKRFDDAVNMIAQLNKKEITASKIINILNTCISPDELALVMVAGMINREVDTFDMPRRQEQMVDKIMDNEVDIFKYGKARRRVFKKILKGSKMNYDERFVFKMYNSLYDHSYGDDDE